VVVCEGEQNHFHPDYRSPGEPYVPPLTREIDVGYLACRKFMEANDVQVLNASRKTSVTAFDRIDTDQVLS
jgi:hypothetical protein